MIGRTGTVSEKQLAPARPRACPTQAQSLLLIATAFLPQGPLRRRIGPLAVSPGWRSALFLEQRVTRSINSSATNGEFGDYVRGGFVEPDPSVGGLVFHVFEHGGCDGQEVGRAFQGCGNAD